MMKPNDECAGSHMFVPFADLVTPSYSTECPYCHRHVVTYIGGTRGRYIVEHKVAR
jgi:hypothetical protein